MAQEVTTAFEATTQRHRAEEAFLQDLADRQRGMLKNVVMFQPGLLFTSNVTYVLSPVDGPGYVPPPAERLPTQATDPAPPSRVLAPPVAIISPPLFVRGLCTAAEFAVFGGLLARCSAQLAVPLTGDQMRPVDSALVVIASSALRVAIKLWEGEPWRAAATGGPSAAVAHSAERPSPQPPSVKRR